MNDYYITIDHYITICQTSLTSNISKKLRSCTYVTLSMEAL